MSAVDLAERPVRTTPRRDESRPIRVCYLIDELTEAGTETQLLRLIALLDRDRVSPYLCLLRGESARSRALEPTDCPVLRLDVRSLWRPSTVGAARRFVGWLRRERIDVLQAYFPDSTYFGVPLARVAGVPFVLRTRNNTGYWMTSWDRRLNRVCDWQSDGLIANCAACRDSVLAAEGVKPHRVVVLENGVDLDRFPASAIRYRKTARIGAVANLRRVKGLDFFLGAGALVATRRKDATFVVAGEGPERAYLEGFAQRFRVPVTLPGSVADVPGFLAGLDIAILSSQSEGMSNALLEYMAAGRPIVATAVGGNASLIEDGKTGLLVPPADPERLARAILRLLDDPALAARLGRAARQKVETHYGREAMVRRFEDFYTDLIGGVAFAR